MVDSLATENPDKGTIESAFEEEVQDKDGVKHRLGDLVQGMRTCLIFIRHYCESIPPIKLRDGTKVIVIGCGTHHPIGAYATKTSSPYPIYTNPSLSLYKLFDFKSTLAGEGKDQPPKDYMQNGGNYFSRVMGGVKGALADIGNVNNVGKKSQNGGEVILSAYGECEYMYRMQNTVDHTSLAELGELLTSPK